MLTEINPRLSPWFFFNAFGAIVIGSFFAAAYSGKYHLFLVGLCLIPIFLWALFYGRRPRLILQESTITISLFLYKKELAYNSIDNLFLFEKKRSVSYGIRKRWTPRFWYLSVVILAVAVFCVLLTKESFQYSIKISFLFFIVMIIMVSLMNFLLFLFDKMISKMNLGETNLAIKFSPTSFTKFPFSYYKNRPICYRIKAVFTDITEKQYLDLITILRIKLDSKAFNL